jgi:hypothetical protein
MSEFNKLRNSSVIGSVVIGVGGVIISLSPVPGFVKSLGNAIAVGSLGSLAATQLIVDSSEKIGARIKKQSQEKGKELVRAKETAEKGLEALKRKSEEALKAKSEEIVHKELEISSKAHYIEVLAQKNNELQAYIASLKADIEGHKETVLGIRSANSDAVVELLSESFTKIGNQMKGLLAHFGKDYLEVTELQEIAIKYAEKVEKFGQEINALSVFTTSDELIEASLALQHEIIHHTALLKLKAYKAVVDYLESTLEGMVSLDYHQDAIAKVKEHYERNYKAVIDEYASLVETANADYSNDLQQLCNQGLSDAQLIEALKLEIHKLNQDLKESRKPHKFVGGAEQSRVGNELIDYYFKFGYTLDASSWESTETGYILYFYKDRNARYVDLETLNDGNNPDKMKEHANSLNLPKFKQSDRSSRIYLEIQKSYPVKKQLSEADIKLLIGTPEEFIKYVVSNPIRYRLIADPGKGKTPTTAVMISEILKVGCTKGNTGKGEKVPHTLVTVSYPDAESSQKDINYPLEPFLKYGNTTAGVKSFNDCLEDGRYRSHNTKYAAEFFHIWVWDEFDNTINSADDAKGTGENIKHILKQFGHKNIGWIVSGQSVMTKQLPGFMNDDRRLFTEIIIDIPKIRKYLKEYGKETLSDRVIETLQTNLDKIEEYVEIKNNQITDDARLLRVALVLDSRSPKLYFLPNLDSVDFDYKKIEDTRRLAEEFKRQVVPIRSATEMAQMAEDSQNAYTAINGINSGMPPIPAIGGMAENGMKPHCPHCNSNQLTLQSAQRYYCLNCKKRSVESKLIWK